MLLVKSAGSWCLASSATLDSLVAFLDVHQVYLNNLGSRAGDPQAFLRTSEWRICLHTGDQGLVDAVFAVNKRGFCSVHAVQPEEIAPEIRDAARLLGGWTNFIHTVMGNAPSVDAVLPVINAKLDARIEYRMMVLGSRPAGPRALAGSGGVAGSEVAGSGFGSTEDPTAAARSASPPFGQALSGQALSGQAPIPKMPPDTFNGDFKLFRSGSEDLRKIFPLQLEYEKEEVQLPGRSIDPVLTRMHLERNLRDQIAVHGEYRGKVVTKAMTNARGTWVDQVGGVYTLPQYRGSGFAKLAMIHLIGIISGNGKAVSLFVKNNNEAALALYRGLGFRELGPFSIAYFL